MKKCRGMTLFELLLAISVVALLAGLSCLVWPQMINTLKINQLQRQLAQTLQQARLNALSTGDSVMVVPLDVQGWSRGWKLVRVEAETQHAEVLQQYRNPYPTTHITLTAFPRSDRLAWEANGLLQQNNGHFTIAAGSDDNLTANIIISKVGRIRYAS